MTEDSRKMIKLICQALDDKKAENVKILDISEISTICDYFIICNGNNFPQVQALLDNVTDTLAREGYHARNVEGQRACSWVLMDYEDIIVHIFNHDDRKFYDLERIWRDGRSIDPACI